MFSWLTENLRKEKLSILILVVFIYSIMMYEIVDFKVIAFMKKYVPAMLKAAANINQIAYLGLTVVGILFFLWSTLVVVLTIKEMIYRLRHKNARGDLADEKPAKK